MNINQIVININRGIIIELEIFKNLVLDDFLIILKQKYEMIHSIIKINVDFIGLSSSFGKYPLYLITASLCVFNSLIDNEIHRII